MKDLINLKDLTNANIKSFDYDMADRHAMLARLNRDRKLVRSPRHKQSEYSGNLIGTCLSGKERRASLKGFGGLRGLWWNACSFLLRTLVHRGSLERSMYTFHSSHHAVTLFRLQFMRLTEVIMHEGVLAGVKAQLRGDFDYKRITTPAKRSI